MASEIKPIYGTERVKLASVLPLPAPYSAFIFPTTYCNFKCRYCGHSLGHKAMKEQYNFTPEHMSMATFRKTVAQLAEFPNKLKMISLTGQGEPLLNPHIAEMVKIIKEADITERVEIITNASLLSHEVSDALIAAGLDTLRISLQGLSAEKYQSMCGAKIDFAELLDNIKYFYENKNATNLFIKVMDVALDDGEEVQFYEIFRNCTDRMYIEHMLPAYDGVEMTKGMEIECDRYGNKTEQINKVCPLAFYMIGIFPNGDVEPCDTIYKPVVLGNVHDDTLLNMWHSDKLRDFWHMHLNGRRWDNKRCANCCAPNDVAHVEDYLDDAAGEIMRKIEGM